MRFGIHLPRQRTVTPPDVDAAHINMKMSTGLDDHDHLGTGARSSGNSNRRGSILKSPRSKMHRVSLPSRLLGMLRRGKRRHRTLKQSKLHARMDRTVTAASCSTIESFGVRAQLQGEGDGITEGPSDEPERRRSISFQGNDTVISIPASRDYPEDVRLTLWGSPVEMFRDVRRNMREYRAEGRNWRDAVEEDVMPVCPKTGIRIHPAHLDGLN